MLICTGGCWLSLSPLTGLHILDVSKTWEKLMLAARVIVAVESNTDVIAISARPYAQRAVLKFCSASGAQTVSGRFTPGTFTNQITKQFREPRVLVVGDPRQDFQVRASPHTWPVSAYDAVEIAGCCAVARAGVTWVVGLLYGGDSRHWPFCRFEWSCH